MAGQRGIVGLPGQRGERGFPGLPGPSVSSTAAISKVMREQSMNSHSDCDPNRNSPCFFVHQTAAASEAVFIQVAVHSSKVKLNFKALKSRSQLLFLGLLPYSALTGRLAVSRKGDLLCKIDGGLIFLKSD